ncbi:MAG TPA: antibiotic biosynthesis monooxygenase [Phytomonospora sp.]
MSILTITRMTVQPADADELVSRHADLVRVTGPGLADARLGRFDETTWVAVWRWDSAADLAAAREGVGAEAAAAFALTSERSMEEIELHDVK